MDLTALSIHETAQLLKDKKISPVELTQAHLERIEETSQALLTYMKTA